METTLKENIAKCVEKNILFNGRVGTTYSVQDLFHMLNRQSLDKLYKSTKKQLDGLDTDSLYENSNTRKKNLLQLQVDTIKGVFDYKTEQEKAEKAKEELRKQKQTLLALKQKKEVEQLDGMSLQDIEKKLEEIEV